MKKKSEVNRLMVVVSHGLVLVVVTMTALVRAQWIDPSQMLINIAAENAKVRFEASDFSLKMMRMDDEEKRESYEEWKEEVEDLVNGGDMLGAAREWTIKEHAMWEHRRAIGGDCIPWFKKMRAFWQRTMERQQQQIKENMEYLDWQIQSPSGRGGIQGIKCPRCGDTYYGQFTCPRCSSPRY